MNRKGYVPLPFLKLLHNDFALKREVTITLIDASCYCCVYYNRAEGEVFGFKKNVQIVAAIMKLIRFRGEKKGSHRIEELPLFQLCCVESGRS